MNKLKKAAIVILIFTLSLSITVIYMIVNNVGKNNITNTLFEKNKVTLITVSMHGGSDPNAKNYQKIVNKFMNEYPYITIDDYSEVSTQEWKTKIAADFAVGNEPDVIQFFTDRNAGDVLATDKFVAIEEILKEYPDYAGNIFPSFMDAAANPDGIKRAVPTKGFWEGLYCHKDLFDRYNLELPTTWDKFLTAIETFRANDIIPIAVSLNEVPHYWLEFFLFSASGEEAYKTVPETSPKEWIYALEMLKVLSDLGAFPPDTGTIDNTTATDLFNSKKAAMKLEGDWFLPSVTDQKNTVVIACPQLPNGKGIYGNLICGISTGFYITKKAWNDPDKRDAAVKFIMAHTCTSSLRTYWNGIGIAAGIVEPLEDMTPLARSALSYSNTRTVFNPPTDSRISLVAYNHLYSGIIDIVLYEKPAEELVNEVIELNAK